MHRIKKIIFENKFIYGMILVVTSNAYSKGLTLLTTFYIGRELGKDLFGEYSLIRSSINMFFLLAAFGIGYTITKKISNKEESNANEIKKLIYSSDLLIISFNLLIGLIVFGFSNYIAREFLLNENLGYYLKFSIIIIFSMSMNNYHNGILNGLKQFKTIANINIIWGTLYFPIMIFSTYYFRFNGAFFGLLLTHTILFVLYRYKISKILNTSLFKSYREIGFSISFLNKFKSILIFSFPIAIGEGVYPASIWLSNTWLLKHTNIGDVGIYNAALQWSLAILFIPTVLTNFVLSYLSSTTSEDDFRKMYTKNLLITIFITVTTCLSFILLGQYIEDFYGEDFIGFRYIFSLLAISLIPLAISNVSEQALIAMNKPWIQFFFKAMKQMIFLLIAGLLFVNNYNSASIPIAMIISYSFICMVQIVFIRIRIK